MAVRLGVRTSNQHSKGEFLHGLAPADIASNAAGAGHDHGGSRNLSVRLAPPPSRRFAPASHTVHAKD
jgi:hypothetical protein